MTSLEQSVSPTSTAVADHGSVVEETEDTPLLEQARPQGRQRRRSSAVGNDIEHGYHTLPPSVPEDPSERSSQGFRDVFGIISVLLVGVFISQADTTLLLATVGNISSEFNDLEKSEWLFSGFGLAMCVAQPLYGKLSDIFGRKAMLQLAYLLFALGGVISGLGRSMAEVITGRVIQGLGGAGTVALVSILITDLVPLREVASYRSYVNIVQTVGRSCGGPIGGALAQSIGWRWAFLLQAPFAAIAMVLVAWKLSVKTTVNTPKPDEPQTIAVKLKRIDFIGAISMSATILGAMLILDLGGQKVEWQSPIIIILACGTLLSGMLFYIAEKKWAKEPVFPLSLLTHKHVVLDYALLSVQIASQTALIWYIPLYFQVTKNAGPAKGGLYMVPTVLGNTTGGLVTGYYIKRTGRYKQPLILSGLSAILCFVLLLLTWHGKTPTWQALFVFLGGFATGIAYSAVFVDLAASVDESEMAIASSGLYLSANIGAVTGVTAASAVFGTSLKNKLMGVLLDWPNGEKIAEKAASNVEYVQGLHGKLHQLIVSAYVFAFRHAFWFSLCCGTCTLILALIVREKKLHH